MVKCQIEYVGLEYLHLFDKDTAVDNFYVAVTFGAMKMFIG